VVESRVFEVFLDSEAGRRKPLNADPLGSEMRAPGLLFVVAALCLAPCPSNAGWDCELNYYLLPGVANLEVVEGGVELTLLAGNPGKPCSRLRYHRESKTWNRAGDTKCSALQQLPECESPIPLAGLNTGRILELRPDLEEYRQSWIEYSGKDFDLSHEGDIGAAACVVHDEHVWFSLAFYSGEGEFGVGGIGRSDRATGESELRHPEALRSVSSRRIAHDGDSLWINTLRETEVGLEVALGLVRYHWGKGELETFDRSVNEGPCGDMVNDILFHEGVLWVATDLGLSRWFKSSGRWVHSIPSHLPEEERSCEEVLRYAVRGALGRPGSVICDLSNPLTRYYDRLLSLRR
jgi:hypothetical protein